MSGVWLRAGFARPGQRVDRPRALLSNSLTFHSKQSRFHYPLTHSSKAPVLSQGEVGFVQRRAPWRPRQGLSIGYDGQIVPLVPVLDIALQPKNLPFRRAFSYPAEGVHVEEFPARRLPHGSRDAKPR